MVVVYDNVQTSGDWTYNFKLHQETLYTLSQQTYGIVDFCWDGFCSTESLYNSYDENYVRRKSWLAGPQYDKSGNPLMYRGEPFSITIDHKIITHRALQTIFIFIFCTTCTIFR